MPHPVFEDQRVDGAELQRGVFQNVYGPDDREDAEREGQDADADVVGHNGRRSDRRRLVQIVPPPIMIFDLLDDGARQVSEVGEVVVAPGREESREHNGDEYQKDRESVAGRPPEDRGEVIKIEVHDGARAFRLVAIDQSVGADDQVVQVVDQPLVPRFDPRDGQVGGGPPVASPEFAHLVATQTAQPPRRACLINQLFQPLPIIFALLNEIISHPNIGTVPRAVATGSTSDWSLPLPVPYPPSKTFDKGNICIPRSCSSAARAGAKSSSSG